MRIIRLFLVTLLFIPFVSNAQDRVFDETILVLNATNFMDYEDPTGCDWALPYLPNGIQHGGTLELKAIMSNRQTGAMTKNAGVVGGIQTCWSVAGEEVPDPIHDMVPYQTIVFGIALGDESYGALGTIRNIGGGEFPHGSLFSVGAIIVEIVDDQPGDPVGSMTMSALTNFGDVEGYNGNGLNGIVTIRMFEDRDYGADALAEILGIDSN